eukprot:g9091.t1 g9091   contig34:821625-822476(+)
MGFSFVSFLAAVFVVLPLRLCLEGGSSVKSPLFVTKPIIYGLDILLLQHAVCALAGFEDDVLGVKKLPIASKAKVVNRYTGSTVSRRNIVDAARRQISSTTTTATAGIPSAQSVPMASNPTFSASIPWYWYSHHLQHQPSSIAAAVV